MIKKFISQSYYLLHLGFLGALSISCTDYRQPLLLALLLSSSIVFHVSQLRQSMARRNLLVALVSFLLILNVAGVFSATFAVINKCRQTVWPGILSTAISSLNTTGFPLQKDESRIITVPSSWSGRFWGRTNCSQNSTGYFSCISGDCGSGKVECSGRSGKPPTTLAEFALNTPPGIDFFEVRLIDGLNLPMLVVPEGGKRGNCITTSFTCTSANYVITFCPPLTTINNGQIPEAVAANTISAGETLSPLQTITSKDGSFKMGLFTPGIYNYYIGIWYSIDTVSVQTVVWVANRDKPIKDPTSSEFKLLENGNLVLYDASKSLIWSTNSALSASNTTEAVLGDDGNLVIRDSSSPSVVYWQSFDHPTHIWLPGAKIGLNKKTNETQVLTSWRSPYDPAPGIFSLELDPTGISQYLIKWNKSKVYLTSGEWSEEAKNFPFVPEMGSNDIYNFSYISNEDESYFTYNLINSSILARFVLDVSGQIKQYTLRNLVWSQPKQFCDVHGICGPFGNCNQDTLKCECLPGFVERYPSDWNFTDSTGGCIRNSSWECGLRNGFSPIPISKLPEDPQSREVNSAESCNSACQKTCSCYGYAYENASCQ
ncbi:hypothetical protein C5167_041077 [Papaver somniferum]|uniref:Bulb-type lectin domain-containing protein n=1 Tax=Papaver somniferum TaxID=3469 RepID=A0A4Y7IKX7_PAPSO|nr:hypothetical protein C5167_041077 [Papaver somniferum]